MALYIPAHLQIPMEVQVLIVALDGFHQKPELILQLLMPLNTIHLPIVGVAPLLSALIQDANQIKHLPS